MSTHNTIGPALPSRASPCERPARRRSSPVAVSGRIALGLILLIAVGLRLTLFVVGPSADIERAHEPDSRRYVELATNLRTKAAFGRAAEDSGVVHIPLAALRAERGELEAADEHGLRPEIFRTPGYPAFIATFEALGLGLRSVLVGQALLGAVSVLAVYGLGRRLLGATRPALLAAFIVAVHPAAVISSASILAETLFTCMILTGLWVVVRRPGSIWAVTVGGFAIGLAVLVRPIAILLGVAVAMWMVATKRQWRTLPMAVCLVVASLLPAAAWMARNAKVAFGWQISSVPPINTLFYTVAYMHIAEAGGDYAADWPTTVNGLFGELHREIGADETAFAAMNRLSLATVRAEPDLYAKVLARSAVKFMTDHSAGVLMARLGRPYQPTGLRDRLLKGDWSFHSTPDRAGLAVAGSWTLWNLLLAALMVLGAAVLMWRRRWSALLLLGGLMVYFLLATQANGLERFRVPVLGIQALLAVAVFVPRLRCAGPGPQATPL